MDANRLTLDEHWLERLNRQTVKSRSAVQQYWMPFSYLFENIPDLWRLALNHLFSATDGVHVSELHEPPNNERLKQNERHLLRQTALVKLQLRSDHDHRTARVVHSLAEQVLAEAALFALERIGERLERAVVGSAQNAAAAPIVKQRIDRFLQHALLVADNHIGRVQLHQLLEPVVAVDHPAIEVVQVRGGEATAIERHQWSQLRRKNRNHIKNHPLGLVAAFAKRLKNLEPLGVSDSLLQARIDLHLLAKLLRELFDIHAAQQLLDGLGAHGRLELPGIFLLQFAKLFLRQNVLFPELGDLAGIDAHKGLEVQDMLEIAHGDIEQVTDAARKAFEEPHMRAR